MLVSLSHHYRLCSYHYYTITLLHYYYLLYKDQAKNKSFCPRSRNKEFHNRKVKPYEKTVVLSAEVLTHLPDQYVTSINYKTQWGAQFQRKKKKSLIQGFEPCELPI